jgi:hypothetical protein
LSKQPVKHETAHLSNKTLEQDSTLKAYRYYCHNEFDHEGYAVIQVYLDEELAVSYFRLNVSDDKQAVMQIYATTVKTAVIKRDTDVLTKEEERTH